MNTKKRVNHSSVCPKLYAMQYVHLRQDHNNTRIKYSIVELKSTHAKMQMSKLF